MVLILLSMLQLTKSSDDILEIRMPGVIIPHNDTYYHLQYELKSTIFITGYKAVASSDSVHHMLLYGCGGNPRDIKVWIGGTPCDEGQDPHILWSWAPGGLQFDMPVNVSMVAGNMVMKFVVLKLHYKEGRPESYRDTSGVDVHFTTEETAYQAGIYLFEAYRGLFPAGQQSLHIDLACNYTSPEIHVFAFRTHAHHYATMISGYRVRNDTWLTLGSRDPRLPEMMVRTEHVITILPQDKLYARCEYDTTSTNETVVIGNTKHDEMCNLYLMYYTDSSHIKDVEETCTNTVQLPNKVAPWYASIFKNSQSITILMGVILSLLVGVPLLLTLKNKYCPPPAHRGYKHPNDGFEKLFGPDDDEEEEILYKSHKDY